MNEILQIADQAIRWITLIAGGFIALLIFIYRSKVKELEKLTYLLNSVRLVY